MSTRLRLTDWLFSRKKLLILFAIVVRALSFCSCPRCCCVLFSDHLTILCVGYAILTSWWYPLFFFRHLSEHGIFSPFSLPPSLSLSLTHSLTHSLSLSLSLSIYLSISLFPPPPLSLSPSLSLSLSLSLFPPPLFPPPPLSPSLFPFLFIYTVIIISYGFEHMVTLQRLEEIGWLKEYTLEVSEGLTKNINYFKCKMLTDTVVSICYLRFHFQNGSNLVLKLFIVLCTELQTYFLDVWLFFARVCLTFFFACSLLIYCQKRVQLR